MNARYETSLSSPLRQSHLSGKDWPYSMNSVFNAGATLLPDGSTLLLCRVEDRRGLSHLCVARSVNGVDGWQIDREPTLLPDPERYPEELWGIEDPRITYVPELKQYAVAYTSYSRGGPGVSLALTKDFRAFERWASSCRRTTKMLRFCPEGSNGHLGADSSPDDASRRSYLDFVLARLAPLGQSQAHARGASRRVVGC